MTLVLCAASISPQEPQHNKPKTITPIKLGAGSQSSASGKSKPDITNKFGVDASDLKKQTNVIEPFHVTGSGFQAWYSTNGSKKDFQISFHNGQGSIKFNQK